MKNTEALKLPKTILGIIVCLMMSCTSYRAITTVSLTENLAHAPGSLSAGKVIRLDMKGGEVIEYLKVTAVDSMRIAGVQTIVINGNRTSQTTIVKREEIVRIQKQRHQGEVVALEDILRLTLKDGEHIKKFRVKEIDSLGINGVEPLLKNESSVPIKLRQIPVSDIDYIWKRGYSPGKTIGLVFGVLGISCITTFIVGIFTDPCHTIGAGCN